MWHFLWLWVYDNAPTIQAVLGILALLGLVAYTIYTRSLVQISQAQMEAILRPILSMDILNGQMFIKNVGTGPALNVEYVAHVGPIQTPQRFKPILGIGEQVSAGSERDFMVNNLTERVWTFQMTYESVSGTRYRSTAEWMKDREGLPYALRVERIGPKST